MDKVIEERLNTNYLRKMPPTSTMVWNATISGHTQHNHDKEALEFPSQMISEGINPLEFFSFVSVHQVCSKIKEIEQWKQVHRYFMKVGFEVIVFACSALVDMYGK